jgi:hypothetical protein
MVNNLLPAVQKGLGVPASQVSEPNNRLAFDRLVQPSCQRLESNDIRQYVAK